MLYNHRTFKISQLDPKGVIQGHYEKLPHCESSALIDQVYFLLKIATNFDGVQPLCHMLYTYHVGHASQPVHKSKPYIFISLRSKIRYRVDN